MMTETTEQQKSHLMSPLSIITSTRQATSEAYLSEGADEINTLLIRSLRQTKHWINELL